MLQSKCSGTVCGCHMVSVINVHFGRAQDIWHASILELGTKAINLDLGIIFFPKVSPVSPSLSLGMGYFGLTSAPDSIIATHNDSMQRYRAAIEDVIVPLLQHNCPAKDQHETHTQSCEHLSAIGHSLQQLFNIGLWPTSNIDQMSTSIVSSKIDEFRNYERSPAAEYYLEGEHYIGCDSLRMDIKQRLLEATKEALEKTKGLCLSCVKRGKVTSEEGNCHAEEEILCSEHMEHVAITNAV